MSVLSCHARRILLLMMLKGYTLLVWHEVINSPITLNDRTMPRLTWDHVWPWLDAGLITLWQYENYEDGGMIYGVYKLTERGRMVLIGGVQ